MPRAPRASMLSVLQMPVAFGFTAQCLSVFRSLRVGYSKISEGVVFYSLICRQLKEEKSVWDPKGFQTELVCL